MVLTFQLMLPYTLLYPLVSACGHLLNAVGQPKVITWIQLVRIGVFVPSVIVFAHLLGINGVAVAADLMLGVGIGLAFRQAKRYVDFSIGRMLLLVPVLGLGLGTAAALGLAGSVTFPNDWTSLLGKGMIATLVYLSLSLALERREYLQYARLLWNHIRSY